MSFTVNETDRDKLEAIDRCVEKLEKLESVKVRVDWKIIQNRHLIDDEQLSKLLHKNNLGE